MLNFDNYFEPDKEPIEELFEEYKQKCMEQICNSIETEINDIKENNQYLVKQNAEVLKKNTELSYEVHNLNDEIKQLKQNIEENKFLVSLINSIKTSKGEDFERKIFQFLDIVFKTEYEENWQDVPIWLHALTQYYSHKEEIIRFLKSMGTKVMLPKNVENFRLPIDWTEEEMDIFFENIYKHVNCNGCSYKDNLRFWSISSLLSVRDQCVQQTYSEIPWQYVLRNPILKKEKYLKQIGEHLTDDYANWYKFEKIQDYLDLNEEEIKIILENINYVLLTSKTAAMDFAFKNIKLVENEIILDKVFVHYKDSYVMPEKILEFPYAYVRQWYTNKIKGNYSIINWLNNNKKTFTKEEREELIKITVKAGENPK